MGINAPAGRGGGAAGCCTRGWREGRRARKGQPPPPRACPEQSPSPGPSCPQPQRLSPRPRPGPPPLPPGPGGDASGRPQVGATSKTTCVPTHPRAPGPQGEQALSGQARVSREPAGVRNRAWRRGGSPSPVPFLGWGAGTSRQVGLGRENTPGSSPALSAAFIVLCPWTGWSTGRVTAACPQPGGPRLPHPLLARGPPTLPALTPSRRDQESTRTSSRCLDPPGSWACWGGGGEGGARGALGEESQQVPAWGLQLTPGLSGDGHSGLAGGSRAAGGQQGRERSQAGAGGTTVLPAGCPPCRTLLVPQTHPVRNPPDGKQMRAKPPGHRAPWEGPPRPAARRPVLFRQPQHSPRPSLPPRHTRE